jgi:hypothetical protein
MIPKQSRANNKKGRRLFLLLITVAIAQSQIAQGQELGPVKLSLRRNISNVFNLDLFGSPIFEALRFHHLFRVESSSDLKIWSAEPAFFEKGIMSNDLVTSFNRKDPSRLFRTVFDNAGAQVVRKSERSWPRVDTFEYVVPLNLIPTNESFLFPVPIRKNAAQESEYWVTGANRWEPVIYPDCAFVRIFPSRAEPVHIGSKVIRSLTSVNRRIGSLSLAALVTNNTGDNWQNWLPFDPASGGVPGLAGQLINNRPLIGDCLDSFAGWVSSNIQSKVVNGSYQYWTNLSDIIQHGTGQCEQQAAVFSALCQNVGIPVRFAFGIGLNRSTVFLSGYPPNYADGHTWVEVCLPEFGWVPFEPTVPGTLGTWYSSRVDFGSMRIPGYFCRSTSWGGMLRQGETLESRFPDADRYVDSKEGSDRHNAVLTAHRLLHDCVATIGPPAFIETLAPELQSGSITTSQLASELTNSTWTWPGDMESFQIQAGGKVQNKWGIGVWSINTDLSVHLSFWPGATYRIVLDKSRNFFRAMGIDNSEIVEGRHLPSDSL